jgi:Na+/proline symporter
VVVLGIGFVARLSIKTDLDFFLSGRSLPAWITGLAFIAANLGALEILGQAANGAQYGVPAVHYYWLGAVPAMVFLGIVMMPFYYGAKVRSVPEYLRLRFNEATHAFNAATFAVATVLISGVNLFALALIIHLMLGWSIILAILVAAAMVLVYITLGSLTSAIYNEVLQFFIIILPGLIAVVTVRGLGIGSNLAVQYNTAVPHLIGSYLPEGMLGLAVTGLVAAFMAGVAANVTAFNTVVTYDLIQSYFVKDRDPAYYIRAGRLVTIAGILISVLTALIAKGYSNIMNYIQTLFSIFNAPLFATFIIAMFWKRATGWGGFFSLVAGTAAAYATNRLPAYKVIFHFGSPLSASF